MLKAGNEKKKLVLTGIILQSSIAFSFNYIQIAIFFHGWRIVETDTSGEQKELILGRVWEGYRAREVGRLVEKYGSVVLKFLKRNFAKL